MLGRRTIEGIRAAWRAHFLAVPHLLWQMEAENPKLRQDKEAKDVKSRKRSRVEAEEPENEKRIRKVTKLPTGVCVKVTSLRPRYNDLEQWCRNPRHVLVTRHGRVFIGKGDKKHVFSYPSSDWANPFKVKEHGLEKSLELFDQYLTEKISDPAELEKFLKLRDYDEIGCFCEPGAKCHRDIIRHKLVEALENQEYGTTN